MPAGLAEIEAVAGESRVQILVPVQTQETLPVQALLPMGLLPIGMHRNSGRILLRGGQQVSHIQDRMS
jgi:hypothetical protein